MIIFHAIFARKHGELNGYPIIAAFGGDGHTAVLEKYEEIVADAAAFAQENAELLQFTVDGITLKVGHHHHWEDPKDQARREEQAQLAEALQLRDEQNAAQAAFDAAKDRVTEAKDGLKTLTQAQKKLLSDYDEKAEAAAAKALAPSADEAAQAEASAAEQERQRQAEIAQRSQSIGLAIDHTGALGGVLVGAPESSATDKPLEDHTVEELREVATRENADLTGLTLKADIIAAIELNREPLENHTVDQLKAIAARENIDLSGASLKADIIAAMNAARTASPAPGENDGSPPLPLSAQ